MQFVNGIRDMAKSGPISAVVLVKAAGATPDGLKQGRWKMMLEFLKTDPTEQQIDAWLVEDLPGSKCPRTGCEMEPLLRWEKMSGCCHVCFDHDEWRVR